MLTEGIQKAKRDIARHGVEFAEAFMLSMCAIQTYVGSDFLDGYSLGIQQYYKTGR